MAEDTGPNHARYESPIRKLIFESALIVFSILLALAANQWNDARKQRALVNRALAADGSTHVGVFRDRQNERGRAAEPV
jgi:hypothetical protein